jgi:hypothetical protein
MSNKPSLSVSFSNGNLLQNIQNIDGVAGMVGTGATNGNLNKVFVINSVNDAINQGITSQNEPKAFKEISEFYNELGGNQQLYVLLLPNTVTMAQMLDKNSATGANLLVNATGGKLSYLGVFRKPPNNYDGGANFIDADVLAAVNAAKQFVIFHNGKLNFFRVLIEGRISGEDSTTIYQPSTANNGYAGVVLGDTISGAGAAIGLTLGRKVNYACHIKLGKVANGALSATAIYIGTKTLGAVANLDALHQAGYITFLTYPGKADFFFGVDNMASTDDYNILVNGAVVDAAAKVVRAVYLEQLEGEVETAADGTIDESAAGYLEAKITNQVLQTMGERISDFKALVDRTVNIVNTSTAKIKMRVLPKGYLTYIEAEIGLTAGN